MKVKKITFFISTLAGGGAEGVCVSVANALSERGWEVTLLVLSLKNSIHHNRLNKKVNLINLNTLHTRNSILPIINFIIKNKPSKFLVFNFELTILLIILRSFLHFKFSIIVRNINTISMKIQNDEFSMVNYFLKFLTKYVYRNADHFINQSYGMRDDLVRYCNISHDKVSVIYNPVNSVIENYIHKSGTSHNNDSDYFLCVGRLEKQKAFHLAIEAFALVANDVPWMRLKIVGQGKLEADLRNLSITKGIADKVDFVGFKENLIPYYLNARATLLTSIFEGFPNVLIESISLGTPVVSFDCPSGPREIIIDGANGFLVEYLNVNEFAKILYKLSNLNISRNLVSNSSRKFRINNIIHQYARILDNH